MILLNQIKVSLNSKFYQAFAENFKRETAVINANTAVDRNISISLSLTAAYGKYSINLVFCKELYWLAFMGGLVQIGKFKEWTLIADIYVF